VKKLGKLVYICRSYDKSSNTFSDHGVMSLYGSSASYILSVICQLSLNECHYQLTSLEWAILSLITAVDFRHFDQQSYISLGILINYKCGLNSQPWVRPEVL